MTSPQGVQIRIYGTVQGVGFRPTVWRLAQQHHIRGTVSNDAQGVVVEAWGEGESLKAFAREIEAQSPPLATVTKVDVVSLAEPKLIHDTFQIIESTAGETDTAISADAATCPDCLAEILDKDNRRYHYPFTNCTHCGPRFSIIKSMPYDRASTSMAVFAMCPSCEAEYRDPASRRFHAQANCCPQCGPKIWLEMGEEGHESAVVEQAAALIRQGSILAIKGIGGFHLVCDATNEEAVQRLRQRKQRPHKPFALMACDIAMVRAYADVGDIEAEQLQATAAPIVLLQKRNHLLPTTLAPNLNTLGFMLPYTPLHHLLLHELQRPLVMTSANRSGEPLVIDNEEARDKLSEIADALLLHDRAIINRLDDSVLCVMANKPRIMRRARGYAPSPIKLPAGVGNGKNILAMGAEMKGSFCLLRNGEAIASQYMGDLKDAASYRHYRESIERYCELYNFTPDTIAIDRHPNYLSSQWGRELAAEKRLPVVEVQHHHAHITAVMAEHGVAVDEKVLGIALDGLGYGDDGTLWGGEFLLADYRGSERLAHFEPIAMPGGRQANREPWRNTFAHLEHYFNWETVVERYGDLALVKYLNEKPLATMRVMVAKGINSPRTSSAGRLFDAVAAALGICREGITYDGQAAIELEALASQAEVEGGYGYSFDDGCIGWKPLWTGLLQDLKNGVEEAVIAARFHHGIAECISHIAVELCAKVGVNRVVLGGGVWQNRILLEQCCNRLRQGGVEVLVAEGVPFNDGGVSLGQGGGLFGEWR